MLAWVLIATLAHAEAPMPEWRKKPDVVMRQLHEACFPSGLRVTLRVDDRQPVIAVTTVVDRGSLDDPPGRAGAAHVLEHLWFRSRPGGGPTVDERLLAAGAAWNAFTLPDVTVYITEVARSGIDDVLRLEAARLIDPLAGIDAATVDQERAIVRTEQALAGDVYFQDVPLRMPEGFFPAGLRAPAAPQSPETLAAVRLDDLKQVATAYRPASTSIYVSGSFDPTALTHRLQDLFPDVLVEVAADGSRPAQGECHPADRAKLTAPVPRAERPPLAATRAPVADPWLVVGWALPAAYGPEEAVMQLAEFRTGVRLRRGLVGTSLARLERFDPGCGLVPGAGVSSLLCMVKVPTGTSPEKLLERVLGAIGTSDLGETGERLAVARARAHAILDLQAGIGELSALRGEHALADAVSNHFRGTPMWFVDAIGALDALDPGQVASFVGRWMRPEDAVAHVLVPVGADPAAVLAATGAVDLRGRGGDTKRVEERDDAAPELHHRSRELLATAVDPKRLDRPRVADFATRTLPNGVRLVAVHQGDVPTVQIGAVAAGGPGSDERVGLSDWAWTQMTPMSDGLPPNLGYTDTALLVGARWWIDRLPGGEAWGLEGTVGNLDGMLWLLRHLVARVGPYPDTDVRREDQFAAEDNVADEADDPDHLARVARVTHLLGPDHPLRLGHWERVLLGSRSSEKELKDHFRRRWRPDNVSIVMIGGLHTGTALDLAEAAFADWAAPKAVAAVTPAPVVSLPGTGVAMSTFRDPDRLLASVDVSCVVRRDLPGAVPAVGTELLRLAAYDHLRTSRLAAYAPRVGSIRWGADEILSLSADVAPADAGVAAAAMLDLLDRLGRDGPAEADVAAVRATLARTVPLELLDEDTVFDLVAAAGEAYRDGVGRVQDELLAVTAADVKAWASGCAGREAVSVIGPEGTVAEPSRAER